ncbi:MAG: ABC transporter ATP-binding protein [Clostridium sp.]|nr:ABC transporter ATP-binding protein [Clostridium sp.]
MNNFIRILKQGREYWKYLIIAGISLLAITAFNLVTPWKVRQLVDVLSKEDSNKMEMIRNIAIVLAVAYILRAIFTYLNRYLSHVAAWKLVADIRVTVYEQLQKLSLGFYHDKQTGQLMSRAINDTATFEVLIAHAVPDLVTNILVLIGTGVLLFIISPLLAALTLIPIPFLIIGGGIFTKKILPNFREAQGTLGELNAVMQDNISGIKEIQAFNQQSRERRRIEKRANKYTTAILHALKLSAVFHPVVEMISSLGTVIVVAFGGWLALGGHVDTADIVGFIMFLGLFYQPITTLARVIEDLQQATAGAERVFELIDAQPDIVDSEGAVAVENSKGKIAFKNVNFHYDSQSPVLKDVSFTAKSGQMVALVGPTGVGKTTIISLIARFYDPISGEIQIDGRNIKDVTVASLRNQISIVLQDVFLFNGSVADNIAYGSRNTSFEEVVRAAKIARAHEFIKEMPEGYDTLIGERGVRLSEGQKQRLSIARAILRDTPILILDEATASVDVETERQIQQAIGELAGNCTIIVIAHRLSTVKKADKILVLKDGEIVERGTHSQLLELDGLYRQLCKVQYSEREEI